MAAMDPFDYEGRLEVLLQETGLKPDQHTCVRFKDDEMTPACTRSESKPAPPLFHHIQGPGPPR